MAEPGFEFEELRAVTENATDLITLHGPDFRFLFANRAMARATARRIEDFPGRTFAEVGLPEHLCREWSAKLEEIARTRVPGEVIFEGRLVQGTRVLQSRISPILAGDGALRAFLWVTRDITEATRAEAMRDGQDQVMKLILSGGSMQQLMERVVDLSRIHVPGRPCSILLLTPDRKHFTVGYAPQVPQALLDSLCRQPAGPDNGCCGAAVHARKLVVCSDIAADPAWAAHREVALAHKLASCWSEPIMASDGEVLGTFAMYHRRPRGPYERELRATKEAALIAGVAIQHWRAQDSMLEAEERFRALTENAANIVTVIGADLRQRYVSPAIATILGYPPAEVIGRPAATGLHPEDAPRVEPMLRRLVENVGGQAEITAFRIRHRDGSWRTLESIAKSDCDRHGNVIVVVSSRDITEKLGLQRLMEFQARHDPLTGLLNRRGFEERVEQLLESARTGHQHALCYIDMDQFKVLNDTCGHVAGDELLRQLPQVFGGPLGDTGGIARLGGDEFAVLLEDCTLEGAAAVARTLRAAVAKFRFRWEQREFSLGVSIGVVGITAESQGLVAILGAADAACYVAKEQGPNQIHVSYPHDLALVRRRGEARWVERLRRAIADDEFCLHYQSIESLQAPGAPRHHELLLRLPDGKGGLILPGVFIPAAERYRLMASIDQWVVAHAIRHLGQLPRADVDGHRFGINLSAESLRGRELLDRIEQLLGRHGVPPSRLYFELTETIAVSNLSAAIAFMQQLRELGCQTALDDFGSGMSSFAYLKHLPADFLKIDGSFVRDVAQSRIDQSIVRSAQAVAHELGIATIAEHVESQATLECLRELGVDFVQGYAIAYPQPLEEFSRLARPPAALESGAPESP